MQEDHDTPDSMDESRGPRGKLIVLGVVAAVVVVGLTAYVGTVVWSNDSDDATASETPSATEEPTELPSESDSPQVVTENLFLAELPEGLCENLADLVAPPEQVGPDSSNQYLDDSNGVIDSYCSFLIEDELATARAGDEFFSYRVEVQIRPKPVLSTDPEAYRTLTEAPAGLDADEWATHPRESGTRDVTIECGPGDSDCDEGDELAVQAEYFEFKGSYANLEVKLHINYYNAADPEALPDRAAATYGQMFTFLAESIPRESD